jgi:DNA-binding MarR family transcriptional regulator
VTDLGGDVDRVLADGLARLVEAVMRHTAALARARDVTSTDVRAAGLLARAGELRPGELARALGISSSGTSSVINRLVAAGLLRRDSGPANQHDVRLRTLGSLRLAPASQVTAACDLLDLGADERERFATFVLRLVELIEADAEGLRRTARRVHVAALPRWS